MGIESIVGDSVTNLSKTPIKIKPLTCRSSSLILFNIETNMNTIYGLGKFWTLNLNWQRNN
jgi:hypothetical protein